MDPPTGTDAGAGDPSAAASRQAQAALAAASRQAQAEIAACRVDVYLAPCVSDALDKYAKALDEIAPDLPPQLHVLPSIVRQAAHRVRAARTNSEVTKVVAQAVSEVNKTIALLRADDPNAAPVGNQVGRDIDRTLAVAEVKLLRTSSL
jgi:hypothetical protein